MQQRFRSMALFLGATSIVGAGLVMVACGTDNGNPVATPSVDGGKTDTGGGKTDGQGEPGGDSAVPEGGVNADCSKNPVLRDNTAGFRCAFMSADAGGPDASPTCTNAQSCCNTATRDTGPGYCADGKGDQACKDNAPPGSTFDIGKGKAWECADKSACGADQVCCIITDPRAIAMEPTAKVNPGKPTAKEEADRWPAACNVTRIYKEGGSRCKSACDGAKDLRLCSLTDPCGPGTVCTPFGDFTTFVDRGYCK